MRIGLVSAFGILFSLLVTLPQRAVSQDTSAAYDPQEEWDGQSGPPPEGSSLGLLVRLPASRSPSMSSRARPQPLNSRLTTASRCGRVSRRGSF
jgi:hypothetical protein